MKKIPNEGDVERTLRSAQAAVRRAWKGANQIAGQALARGRYEEAKILAERAQRVQELGREVEGLRRRWRALRRSSRPNTASAGQPKTAKWVFFQPILKALVEVGGTATRRELEPAVERLMADQLKPGDRVVLAGGRQRWQAMIAWSRKHLSAEGWIEKGVRPTWEITAAGKRAAAKAVAKPAAEA